MNPEVILQQRQQKIKDLDSIASIVQDLQQEIQALNLNRQKFVAQHNENTMAKEELELLKGDATVFKLIGPSLIKQDKEEALDTVKKRLDFIKSTLEKTEKEMAAKQETIEQKKKAAGVLQGDIQKMNLHLQEMQKQQMQQMQQMQQQQQQMKAQ